MRLALVLLVAALSACAGPATQATGEAASCAAPQLTVQPASVAPGDPLDVSATLLFDSCQDTVANGSSPPTPAPLSDLAVVLVQGTEHWTLADGLTARDDGTLHLRVTVPNDVHLAKGTALLGVSGVIRPVPVVIARA
jgi:hypothetical protein